MSAPRACLLRVLLVMNLGLTCVLWDWVDFNHPDVGHAYYGIAVEQALQ